MSRIITRYVFILSTRELGVPDSSINVPEGEVLRFFWGLHSGRVASPFSGLGSPYWTRTPALWGTNTPSIIAPHAVGAGPADSHIGVRPAFSVARYTAITTCTDAISGETVFVLDAD